MTGDVYGWRRFLRFRCLRDIRPKELKNLVPNLGGLDFKLLQDLISKGIVILEKPKKNMFCGDEILSERAGGLPAQLDDALGPWREGVTRDHSAGRTRHIRKFLDGLFDFVQTHEGF